MNKFRTVVSLVIMAIAGIAGFFAGAFLDAGRISEIYDYHVKNTAITFEYNMPCLEEFLNVNIFC